jgi:hypothetical protein
MMITNALRQKQVPLGLEGKLLTLKYCHQKSRVQKTEPLFLKGFPMYLTTMANDRMQHEIDFKKPRISKRNNNNNNDENQATALGTFERGGRMQAQFTFELATESDYNVKHH